MAILDNVKTLLEITDSGKDTLLNLYISRATDYIQGYCKLDDSASIPSSLNSVIEEMAIFQYRQKGVENIQSESKGSLSESYIVEYPPNIMNRLNPHCQVKFI